jgi:cytochrome c553
MKLSAMKPTFHSTASFIASAAAVVCLGVSPAALAADAAKGKSLLEAPANNCASCHGADYAKSTADNIPSLAGQHKDYLVQALKQYKDGDKKGAALSRNNAIMSPKAKLLSESDIDNIAAYLSSLKGNLSVQK